MAVVATPIFVQSPKTATLNVSTANANTDGTTGSYSAAITFDADGAILECIKVIATGTTTAGKIRIFYADDGTNYDMLAEIPVTAVTPSAGTMSFGNQSADQGRWVPPHGVPLNLTGSSKLKASTLNSEAFNIFVTYGDF